MVEEGSPFAPSPSAGPLRQAEILSEVPQVLLPVEGLSTGNDIPQPVVVHKFVLVLSQDCDLDWDYRARYPKPETAPLKAKDLPSVLFCETREVPDGFRLEGFDGDLWKRIRQNQDERYHVLPQVAEGEDAEREGVPMLLLDFKRYFALTTAEVYARIALHVGAEERVRRRCLIGTPWREDVSRRFFNYQSRVALPEGMAPGSSLLPVLPLAR